MNSAASHEKPVTAPESLRISPKPLDVALLPQLVVPGSLANRTVIVTDVLRATTTIIHSLSNGCQQVLPKPSIEAARLAHERTENSVMGGERGGRIIDGFHHGNSPLEYTRSKIAGKSLVLATTNGTVAMEHCRGAKRVLVGAMINIGAIVEMLAPNDPVTIVCSGTDGFITSEDVIFAGALVERILALTAKNRNGAVSLESSPPHLEHEQLSDLARIALNHWQSTDRTVQQGTPLADFFRKARGGINLVKIGLDADIVFASGIDTVPVVPELDVESWSIRLR